MKIYLNGMKITPTEAKKMLPPILLMYIEGAKAEGVDSVSFVIHDVIEVKFNKGEE